MRFLLASVLSLAFCMLLTPSHAEAASLKGTWHGGGYIKPNSGAKERVRCRVTYHQETSKVFRVSASCASAEFKLRQGGTILKVRNNRYVGDFYNSDWDVAGRIRVVVNGNSQTVTLKSNRGSARLTLRKR